jgi:hypothetical protein
MKKSLSCLVPLQYLLLTVALKLCFSSCFWNTYLPYEVHIRSLKEAEEKLNNHTFNGHNPNSPVHLIARMDLGNLSLPNNNYLRLIEIVGNSGLYVELILFSARMGGTTVFTSPPLNEAIKGMDKIVVISFPASTTSIMADINGKTPFYYYENLRRVEFWGQGLITIGPSTFSFCKNLESADFNRIIVIGDEAFRGCENLNNGFFPSLEAIGDYAFFDCSALEILYFPRQPPNLGKDVFLGSTPGNLTIYIRSSSEKLYRQWLAENASKFNNYGEDVVLRVFED